MDRERAETYLRLLAEAELRRATTIAARGAPGWGPSARLALAAQALSAVGAVGADVADQIEADARLAVAGRHRPAAAGPGRARVRLTSHRASWRVVPVGQAIEPLAECWSRRAVDDDHPPAGSRHRLDRDIRRRAISSGPGHAAARLAATITLENEQVRLRPGGPRSTAKPQSTR